MFFVTRKNIHEGDSILTSGLIHSLLLNFMVNGPCQSVYDIRKLIISVDPDAFITMTPVRHLNGKFNRVIMK